MSKLALYLALQKDLKNIHDYQCKLGDALSHLITQFEDHKLNVNDRLDNMKLKLQNIERKEDTLMSQVAQDFESLRTAIDSATNAVANRIANLSNKITNSMSDQEVASLKQEFQQAADRLNQLAADPDNPVPDSGSGGPVV